MVGSIAFYSLRVGFRIGGGGARPRSVDRLSGHACRQAGERRSADQPGGGNANDATLDSLPDQVTCVFQETQLVSDSTGDNIRFGKPDASLEEVERIARVAGAHDFIAALPEGYDTKLGTSMSKLCVGQKQRIAIARGLLPDSCILILDEPTFALDPENQEYLVRSLRRQPAISW